MSMRECTAELAGTEAQLVTMTSEKLAFLDHLSTSETYSIKRAEKLLATEGDRVRVKSVMRFVLGQSVEALDAFGNLVGTKLLERIRMNLENAYL